MDATQLMEGYMARTKDNDKRLKQLERKARGLANKQAEVEEKRCTWNEQITVHQRKVAALESERSDLQGQWSEADFNNDVAAKREIQTRRSEIDDDVRKREKELERLRTALNALPSYEQESAEIAAELDSLKFGNSVGLFSAISEAIHQTQRLQTNKRDEAKSILPKYNPKQYEDVRRSNDVEYKKRQESKEAEQVRAAKLRKEKEERSRLKKTAIVDQDTGYLKGYEIKNEQGEIVDFSPVKSVPITNYQTNEIAV